ncbi:GNAT family N-acetyltransferase [Yoonia sp.]|uniref:GNAT family N-acetyltransferase n=1 Tax=Yoonia sp. TaxID=2212373 RepID=UPI00391A3809
MIGAIPADQPAIEAFLRQHVTTAMFSMTNLQRYGMAGGHPRALTVWLRKEGDVITDALAVSEEGMIFPHCPTGPWEDVKTVLQGREINGLLGDAGQVDALHRLLGLTGASGHVATEQLYRLTLADSVMPDVDGFTLHPLSEAPRDLVLGWRRAYLQETMQMQGDAMEKTAIKDIDSYVAADSHRVLYRGDQPVAMTGFNAMLPDIVQIGGVFTPSNLRARRLARRAVALHLAQAKVNGVSDAILFAASAQAAKAYESIGFGRIGSFGIALFDAPQVVHG